MRAFAVQSFGEAPGLWDLPVPGADGVFLIRVNYAGINPLDYKLVEQLTATSAYPFVLGVDFAGIVERAPVGERVLRPGDPVFGIARTHGTYAEYTTVAPGVKTESLARIPDGVIDEQAAVLPIAGITALRSLELLGVTAGQWLVVMGATGGVGGYAVQMARSRGVHVAATVRGDADEARRLGAEEVYDTRAVDVIDALCADHSHGVEAVLDLVNGSEVIRRDAEIVKPGGGLVSTLYAADEGWFAERKIAVHNIASVTNPFSSPLGLTTIARMLAGGTITARINSIVPLDSAGEIHERLRGGGLHGKAVVRL
jgi:NADPH:quinone reductase-like Zn-dependent oxidoreductase